MSNGGVSFVDNHGDQFTMVTHPDGDVGIDFIGKDGTKVGVLLGAGKSGEKEMPAADVAAMKALIGALEAAVAANQQAKVVVQQEEAEADAPVKERRQEVIVSRDEDLEW